MPIDDRMTVNERRKYLKLMSPRYVKAGRAERGGLLREMETVTGLHRKSLLRLVHAPSLDRAPKRPRVRRRRYGSEVAGVVRVVWESLDYGCAERLTPGLLATAQQLAPWEEVVLTLAVETQLATISRATVQRLLQRFQQDTPKLARHKPQAPNRLLRAVPTERLAWATSAPGSFETDLVHHCGPNATLVRSYLGYDRLDTLRQCEAVNPLYDQLWRYYNLFQPVLHLVGKEVVDGKLKRRWDRAQTPYQRLLASGVLSEVQQARLATLYAATNPRQLREDIYHAVERLWQRPPQAQNGPRACAGVAGVAGRSA